MSINNDDDNGMVPFWTRSQRAHHTASPGKGTEEGNTVREATFRRRGLFLTSLRNAKTAPNNWSFVGSTIFWNREKKKKNLVMPCKYKSIGSKCQLYVPEVPDYEITERRTAEDPSKVRTVASPIITLAPIAMYCTSTVFVQYAYTYLYYVHYSRGTFLLKDTLKRTSRLGLYNHGGCQMGGGMYDVSYPDNAWPSSQRRSTTFELGKNYW